MVKEIIKRVEFWLRNKPQTRDSDTKLMAYMWSEEIDYQGMSAYDFMRAFAEGQLTSPESIRRCRQKLQQENSSLRGNTYNARQKRREGVINEIRDWNNDAARQRSLC